MVCVVINAHNTHEQVVEHAYIACGVYSTLLCGVVYARSAFKGPTIKVKMQVVALNRSMRPNQIIMYTLFLGCEKVSVAQLQSVHVRPTAAMMGAPRRTRLVVALLQKGQPTALL